MIPLMRALHGVKTHPDGHHSANVILILQPAPDVMSCQPVLC